MGIALCHLHLAVEHYIGQSKFVFDKSKDKSPPKNIEYVATLEIEKAS
jgi:hypothetical protein